MREYIWLYETEIAPTSGSRTTVDRPLAVVNAVNTASPATLYVHVDHLNRPVKMTDTAKLDDLAMKSSARINMPALRLWITPLDHSAGWRKRCARRENKAGGLRGERRF